MQDVQIYTTGIRRAATRESRAYYVLWSVNRQRS